MGEPSNAVFISYRRDVGGMLTEALYQHLSTRLPALACSPK